MKLRRSFLGGLFALTACTTTIPAGVDGGIVVPDAHHTPDTSLPDVGQPFDVVNVLVRDAAGAIVGATVIVDDANGMRETAVTGAGGRATVSHVAWGTGRITITVDADGHPLQSLASWRRSELGSRIDGTGTITMTLLAYYRSYGVSGNVINAPSPSRDVSLSLDVSGQLAVTGTTFTGTVARNVPFHIDAIDYVYQSLTVDHYSRSSITIASVAHAPLTSATTFDVDMSSPLPLTTMTGSFPSPPLGNRARSGVPVAVVSSDESYGGRRFGMFSDVALSPDGAHYDYTLTRTATLDATAPITIYYVETTDRIYSEIYVDGPPTAAPIASAADWPAPPRLVTPASGTSAGLHDAITIADVDPALPVRLELVSLRATYWYLDLPPGGGSTAIPAPPDGTDTTSWTNLTVYVTACEPWPSHHLRCRRDAGGDSFDATL
jgi:hypothetical protein